jgi:hypothetical protein
MITLPLANGIKYAIIGNGPIAWQHQVFTKKLYQGDWCAQAVLAWTE